ncbi:alpha/beta fold hydrolase [Bacillus sp. Marseille-P3661]|uniref:alpha/beta fold hydrolase n=1 Tax=Bacillus sp. Marseille-P3661 TaxID=1936234 RepID=UPI0015E18722|nr:alpha/beta hydrolase [Bacillus sp. Marseille-P3661]
MTQLTKIEFKKLNVNGNIIRYYEKGRGEALVYLHDYNGLKDWHPFQDELSNDFRVIAVEFPGFGESERPEWLKTMDDLSFYFLDILDALNLESVHLIGHSLGGWLAADLASRYSERVKSLVLLDAMGLYLNDVKYPDIYMISEEEHKGLRYYNSSKKLESDLDFLELARAQAMTSRLAWTPRFHDPKLKYRLHRINVPTLLLWGEEDQIVPTEYAEEFKKYIPHAQVVYISESSHVPQVEQPEKIVKVMQLFLSQNLLKTSDRG